MMRSLAKIVWIVPLLFLVACGSPRTLDLSEEAGRVWGQRFSPAGDTFLVVEDRALQLRTHPKREQRWRVEVPEFGWWGPLGTAFAPDGQEVAVAHGDLLSFYAAADGSPSGEFSLGDDAMYVPYLAYRPDSSLALLVGRGESLPLMSVEVWNREGEQVGEPLPLQARTTDWGQWQAFSADGNRVVYEREAHILGVVDVATGEHREWDLTEPLHFDDYPNELPISGLAISPDGREIAIGFTIRPNSTLTDAPVVMRVEASTGQVFATLPVPEKADTEWGVRYVAYSPDGQSLALSLSLDVVEGSKGLYLYRLGEAEPQELCEGKKCCSRYPAFSPDGETLATSCGARVTLWDVAP